MIPLAPSLIDKTRALIDEFRALKDKDVPQHMILQFVRSILIPAVNYGAFIDTGDTVRDNYNTIDSEIAAFCRDIISTTPTID